MKKRFLIPLCSVMAVGLLAGCNETHNHDFKLKHDETNHWMECECGEKKEQVAHVFTSSSEAATCEHGTITTYICECGYTYNVDDHKNAHNYVTKFDNENHWEQCSACGNVINKEAHDFELVDVVINDSSNIIQTFKCKHCDYRYTSTEDNPEVHNFKVTIKVPATCQTDGTKLYECLDCDYFFEEPYSDFEAHKWDNGTLNDGVTTYHCEHEGCGETKVVLSHKEKTKADVKVADLEKVGKLELKEATIDFGSEALAGLTKDVTIGAEKIETSTISLPDSTKDLLKDAPVFDFSMSNDGEEVHEFSSNINVSIPYTLKDGEDPDNVGVVYINERGEAENIAAKYSNGFVSFETNHFSYYAVIEISRKDACEILGHNYFTARVVSSTCARQGYIQKICKRCGESTYELLPLEEHRYVFSSTVPSSTTTHGYNEYACSVCGDSYRIELPLAIEGDDGYFLTFVKTILDGGIHFELTETDGKDTRSNELIMSLGDENPYQLTITNGEIDDIIIGETRYYTSYSTHKTTSLSETKSIANAIKLLPSSLDGVLSLVENALYKICLKKTVNDGITTISFDKDVSKSFIEVAKTYSIKDLFNYLFGETAFDFVCDFVEASFARTIQETLDALEVFGIDAKAIFDFVKALPINLTLDYENIFTEDVLNSKGSDLIARYTGETISFSDLKALIDEYSGKTLFEIIGLFASNPKHGGGEDTPVYPEPIPEPFDDAYDFRAILRGEPVDDDVDIIELIIDAYIDSYDFNINTTSDGQFIDGSLTVQKLSVKERSYFDSCEEHVDANNDGYCDKCFGRIKDLTNPDVNFVVYSYEGVTESITFDKNVTMGNYKNAVDAIVNKTNSIADDFILDEEHPFVKNVIEEFYGLKFDVVKAEDFGDDFVSSSCAYCYVSEVTNKYSNLFEKPTIISEEVYDPDNISGRVIIPVYHYSFGDFSDRKINDFRGYFSNSSWYCLGELNSEHEYLFGESMLSYSAYFRFEGFERASSFSNKLSSNFKIYYDVTDEKFGFIPSYLLQHEENYEKISKREYEEYRGYKLTNSFYDGCDFYRITCKYCDYVGYDYFDKGYKPGSSYSYLRDSRLNEEAKKYSFQISRENSYSEDDLMKDRFDIYVTDLYGFNSEFSIRSYGRRNYENFTKTFGNVKISVSYTNKNNFECWKNEVITLSIDDEVINTYTNVLHVSTEAHTKVVDTYTEGCYDYEISNRICDCCGQVLYENTYTIGEHHNMVSLGKVEPTETINGCEMFKCTECGYIRRDTIYHHTHLFDYDYEDNLYHCECGATCENIPYHDFVVEDVTDLKPRFYYHYDDLEDCYVYSFADKMDNYIDFRSYQLVMVGVNNGEIDTNYMVGIGEDRIRSMELCYDFGEGSRSYSYFEGAWVQKETQDNFIASLPEGYKFEIAILRFTDIDPVEKAEMDRIFEFVVESFAGNPEDIYTINKEYGSAYYYGNGISLDVAIKDVSNEEEILNLFSNKFIPGAFDDDWTNYGEGYVYGSFKRSYRFDTRIEFTIYNITFDENGDAHGTLKFEVYKEF